MCHRENQTNEDDPCMANPRPQPPASSSDFKSLQSKSEATELLQRLTSIFPESQVVVETNILAVLTPCNVQDSQFHWAHPDEISVAHHKTLVHEEHLTKVLQEKHGGLEVRVEKSVFLERNVYARKIFLVSPDGTTVAHAILLAFLDRLPAAVGEGVREEKVPFGRLLMQHVSERCVHLMSCWHVELGRDLEPHLCSQAHRRTSGRVVTIECAGKVAAEVLEILRVE
ncbi:hypothetical protein GUITHDRAFT_163897 [Guillardia theta CCMP2712]|uniref:Uncharacterized protein n=1 Tax=Guillardia theta (strain CCMP2712) TaxID=905079 RepID=L1J5G2_GUITC|nr:hypothetical protein GUITHDRAFT_163897 [Guillardia theta CCMP2712]EKX43305.1 hypothetical protein GUITHDRAFT_163897 [Guillardia theta CCMP2712]|eukprot:XP_005830285.1 hypothetical protein GUITHDRAFT_163897 [Guillardia theta CCMP2712]